MSGAIRELQEMLRAEEQRSHDLAACLADMGRVNGRLRSQVKAARDLMERHDFWHALRRENRALPGEYDTLMDALYPPPPTPASQEPTP